MLIVASCGGSDDDLTPSTDGAPAATETEMTEPTETETPPETAGAAPETDAPAETTPDAEESAGAGGPFELTTDEMSAEDIAALPDVTGAVALDPTSLQDRETPGYLFGVWDPDRGAHLAAAGLSEIDTETAMTTDDSFRIGSITKTFVATAVLLLVDDGEVDLDEPVATYTGDLTAALPGGDTATVRQLLGMTSGFPDYTNVTTDPFGEVILQPDYVYTAEELIAAAAKYDATSTDEVTYVNANYIVLGELITEVSGMPYSQFIQERILDTVGLENTVIPGQADTTPVTSHGYLNSSWPDFDDEPSDELLAAAPTGLDVTEMSTSVAGAAGNGVSTLEDLARWAATDFGNSLLSDSSQEARLDSKDASDIVPTSEYGLGIQVIGEWHGHGGEIYGWETQLFANPTTGQIAVVNANGCCGVAQENLVVLTASFPDDIDMSVLLATLLGG